MDTVELNKRGESVMIASLLRVKEGLKITIKVHPDVEALCRAFGAGEEQPIIAHGRSWLVPEKGKPLSVWHMGSGGGPIPCEGGYYRLDRCGQSLLDRQADGTFIINLSCLRLVGASEDAGVSFIVKGVNSPEGIRELGRALHLGVKRFYENHLLPIELIVTVSTEARKGGA